MFIGTIAAANNSCVAATKRHTESVPLLTCFKSIFLLLFQSNVYTCEQPSTKYDLDFKLLKNTKVVVWCGVRGMKWEGGGVLFVFASNNVTVCLLNTTVYVKNRRPKKKKHFI